MEKIMHIEGMMCVKCKGRVERVLGAIDGVQAEVDLDAKTAKVVLSKEVANEELIAAVTEAGFKVVSVD